MKFTEKCYILINYDGKDAKVEMPCKKFENPEYPDFPVAIVQKGNRERKQYSYSITLIANGLAIGYPYNTYQKAKEKLPTAINRIKNLLSDDSLNKSIKRFEDAPIISPEEYKHRYID